MTLGSSPALNIEETRVSAGTGEGNIKSYDTATGIEIWSYYSNQAAAGSVSTTPDGIVYAVPDNGTAIHPESGKSLWSGAELLNSLLEGIPEHSTFGKPIVTSSSIIELAKHKVLQSVNVGYVLTNIGIQGTGTVKNYIITRNRFTGEIIKGSLPYSGRTTMENIMTPHKNGTISLAYGSLNNSKLTKKQIAQVNAMLSSVNQQLLPTTGGLVQIEGIDEATIGDFIDGVIDNGDIAINDRLIQGNVMINNVRLSINIRKHEAKFIGTIKITHDDYQAELKVNQDNIQSTLGIHAVEGHSIGTIKYIENSRVVSTRTLSDIHWVIKDWSN